MGGLSFVTAKLTHLSESREFGKKHRRLAVKENNCLWIFWTRDMVVLVECHRNLPNEENQYLAKIHMTANWTLQPHPQRERRLHCFEKSFIAFLLCNGQYHTGCIATCAIYTSLHQVYIKLIMQWTVSHWIYSYVHVGFIHLYTRYVYNKTYLAGGPRAVSSFHHSGRPLPFRMYMFSTYVLAGTCLQAEHIHNII